MWIQTTSSKLQPKLLSWKGDKSSYQVRLIQSYSKIKCPSIPRNFESCSYVCSVCLSSLLAKMWRTDHLDQWQRHFCAARCFRFSQLLVSGTHLGRESSKLWSVWLNSLIVCLFSHYYLSRTDWKQIFVSIFCLFLDSTWLFTGQIWNLLHLYLCWKPLKQWPTNFQMEISLCFFLQHK